LITLLNSEEAHTDDPEWPLTDEEQQVIGESRQAEM
jgi:hypothetical protein